MTAHAESSTWPQDCSPAEIEVKLSDGKGLLELTREDDSSKVA